MEKIKDTDQEIHEESPQSTLKTDVLIDLVNDVKNKIGNKEVFTNAILFIYYFFTLLLLFIV